MKKTNLLLYILSFSFLCFISCSDDDNDTIVPDNTNQQSSTPIVDQPKEEESKEEGPKVEETKITFEVKQAKNIFADGEGGQGIYTGPFATFDFEGENLSSDEAKWDIGFRVTGVIINGGVSSETVGEQERKGNASVAIINLPFDDVTSIKDLEFKQDTKDAYAIPTGSDNGWYNYSFITNQITPLAGKTFVIKTSEGNYVKLRFLSYYKDGDITQDGRYYTFDYAFSDKDGNFQSTK